MAAPITPWRHGRADDAHAPHQRKIPDVEHGGAGRQVVVGDGAGVVVVNAEVTHECGTTVHYAGVIGHDDLDATHQRHEKRGAAGLSGDLGV